MNNTPKATDPLEATFSEDRAIQSILDALRLGKFEHAAQQTQELYAQQNLVTGGMPVRLSLAWEDTELAPTLADRSEFLEARTERAHARFVRGLIKLLRRESAREELTTSFDDLAVIASLKPDDPMNRVWLANLIIFNARYVPKLAGQACANLKTARNEIRDALRMDPQCAPAHHARGLIRLFGAAGAKSITADPRSYYRKAIDSFAQAVRITPSNAWSHYGLGLAKKALSSCDKSKAGPDAGLLNQAVSHFEEASHLDPHLLRASYKAAQIHVLLNNPDAARRCLARCTGYKPTNRSKLGELEGQLWKSVTTSMQAAC